MTTSQPMGSCISRAQAMEFYVWLSSYRDARDELEGRMTSAHPTEPGTIKAYDRLLEHFLAAFPDAPSALEDPFDGVWARLDQGPDAQRFAEFLRWLEPLGTTKAGEKVDYRDERAPICWAWHVIRRLLRGGRAHTTSAAESEG